MAQPSTIEANGVSTTPEASEPVLSGKRKRELSEEGDEAHDDVDEKKTQDAWTVGNQKELIKSYFAVLSRQVSRLFRDGVTAIATAP